MKPVQTNDTPVRLPPSDKQPLDKVIVAGCSILSGAMLGFAMPNIVSGDGVIMVVKAALLAGSATLVSYGVNRLAVERGAPLAVIGYKVVAVISVTAILAVGGGMFAATYSGLVFDDVEQLNLEAYGQELSSYVAGQAESAAGSAQIIPAVGSIAADLEAKFACEVGSSCMSGKGKGGRGPVARALDDKRGRAASIAAEIGRGEQDRADTLRKISALQGEFDKTAASGDLDAKDKRRLLQGIDLELKQAVAELGETVPVTLLRAYASELNNAGDIPVLGDILRGHAASLGGVIADLPNNSVAAPIFPKPVGVIDTFQHIGHFLPIAAIAAVTELIFPLFLWLYTVFTLDWALRRERPKERPAVPEDEIAIRNLLPGLAALARAAEAAPPNSLQSTIKDKAEARAPSESKAYQRRARLNGHARVDEV